MSMRKTWNRGSLITILWILALLAEYATCNLYGSALASQRDGSKISSWVMQKTENDQQTEFFVVLADQADLSPAQKLPGKKEKGRFVFEALLRKAQETQGPLIRWLQEHNLEFQSFYVVNMIKAKAGRATALALASRPDVARIEGNAAMRNLPEPSPTSGALRANAPHGVEPGIASVRAPEVWTMGFTGQDVVIGGQDTGYQWNHPALMDQYRGWDGKTASHDSNWHDSVHSGGGRCGADSPVPCDDHNHGTHTMGTAVGSDGGENQIGMAPGAKWIGCRNMNQGVGSVATYSECFEFLLAPYPVGGKPSQGDPDKAPDITLNSWSCVPSEGCSSGTLAQMVQAQRAAGIMTIVSAGNSGPGCSTINDPPGIYEEVFTVGALNTGTDTIASFSSQGPVTIDGSNRRKPDIVAPGTAIRSSIPAGTYGSMQGTSMAAPHVAGAVALLWSANPALKGRIDATGKILADSAVHISYGACGSTGWPNNTFGYGRLDVKSAVELGRRRGTKDFLGTWANQGVYYRNSDDSSWNYITVPASMIAASDFDGDGTDDLLGQWQESGIWVKLSTTGQWILLTSTPATSIAAGDLYGDGKAELIGIWDSTIWTLDSSSSWKSISSGANQVATGDLDGDGRTDLIAVWPGDAVWAKYSSTGQWISIASSANWIAAGDLDGDGKDDLLGIWDTELWARSSRSSSWTLLSAGALQAAAADLDGDGKADPIGVWPDGAWMLSSLTSKWVRLSSAPDWIATGRMHP
jgi:serine protease AprX